MSKLVNKLPKYRLHRPSGLAVVTLSGVDHYLGVHGTDESTASYNRKVSEWLANGRLGLRRSGGIADLTIDEIFVRYWAFVTKYYVKDGEPTGEQHAMHSALTPLVTLYGPTLASEFGPLKLKVVRDHLIQRKLSRRLINHRVNRIRRMFKWAVENEYVSPAILHGLQAIAPLRRGRCEAPDHEPVRPLPEETFNATLRHMAPDIAAMAHLQWFTGMRPGEVVLMRTVDVDRSGDVWEYRPSSHKTQHHGFERIVAIGPRARGILAPYLRPKADEYIFSPMRKMAQFNRERRAKRQTPMTPSQAARVPKPKPRKQPGDRYTTSSYAHAIASACRRAGIPTWGPNRLRHSAATRLRQARGLDAARIVLGHRSAEVTTIYAEADRQKAVDAIAALG